MNVPPNPRRCLLFVPGSRPERFAKALAADPDQVCIDLEDAVGPADKASARAAVIDWFAQRPAARSELGFRINGVTTANGQRDLAALAAAAIQPDFLMLPKVESVDELHAAERALGARRTRLIALIESPRGVLELDAIVAATRRLGGVMFGGFDYAVALRGRPGWDAFLLPRARIALAAAAAAIDAIDVPYLDLENAAGLSAETERVIGLGFTAKAAIHPDQVAPIQASFLPTPEDLARAERIVAAIDAARGEAVQVDGKLVDRPIELAARRVVALALAGASSK